MDLLSNYEDSENSSSNQTSQSKKPAQSSLVTSSLQAEWESFEKMISDGTDEFGHDTKPVSKDHYLIGGIVAYPGMQAKTSDLSDTNTSSKQKDFSLFDSGAESDRETENNSSCLMTSEETREKSHIEEEKCAGSERERGRSLADDVMKLLGSSDKIEELDTLPRPRSRSNSSDSSASSSDNDSVQSGGEKRKRDASRSRSPRKRSKSPRSSRKKSSPSRDRKRSRDRKDSTSSKKHRSRSRSRSHSRRHKKERRSSKDRRRRRSKERKKRSRSRERHHKHRRHSKSPSRRRRHSKSPSRHRRHSKSPSRYRRHSKSPSRHRRHRSHSRDRSRSRSKSYERMRDHRPDTERASASRKDDTEKHITFKEKMRQQLLKASKYLQSGEALEGLSMDGKLLELPKEKPSNLPLNEKNFFAELAASTKSNVTPQVALLHTMAAMHQKAQEMTGVAVPKYYNPAAVNPLKYAEQVQKRKLLWSKAKDHKEEKEKEWGSSAFISDQNGKMAAKFKKLMGIKQEEVEEDGDNADSEMTEEQIQKQQELFSRLDKEYEFARMTTHTHRGVGLGFSSQGYPTT